MFAGCAALIACVSGAPTEAPRLTEAQSERVQYVGIYRTGSTPGPKYSVIGPIEAAACSGAAGRLDEKAIDVLKRMTVALAGDAVIEVSCGSGPSLNTCAAARKCTGDAVRWSER